MGMVFGKITVETPKYESIKTTNEYEIRKYDPSVIAQVTYDPTQFNGDKDGGFTILAKYIGALGGDPQNTSPEKIAMTAPVVTKATPASGGGGESIAMTAPVITKATPASGGGGENIAMTAPVVTTTSGGGEKSEVTMQFLLPAKYRTVEEAPRPVDERVVITAEGERSYAVVRFGGVATEAVVAEKVKRLRECLERDGFKVVGDELLARYNPPWTLPPFRTNEVMLPVALE